MSFRYQYLAEFVIFISPVLLSGPPWVSYNSPSFEKSSSCIPVHHGLVQILVIFFHILIVFALEKFFYNARIYNIYVKVYGNLE